MLKHITFLLFLFAPILLFAEVYRVGPGQEYERIIDCPTHDLQAGDRIMVYYREEPYHEKFLLHGVGTAEEPVFLMGVPDRNGAYPVIDGEEAVSSRETPYWNEPRQIILVGQYQPRQSDYIVIDGFEIRNAIVGGSFTDDRGERQQYAENACAIRAEYCRHLVIRNCELHHCMNGFQNTETDVDQFVLLESCYIHENGAGPDSTRYLEHNIYASGRGIHLTVQFCRFGELLNDGQQFKSRAQTNIIRYNWIEGGRNSQLDLVDSDYGEDVAANAYVYGNVIIKPPNTHNSRCIHFGGEDRNRPRKGTMYFFNNTVVIKSHRDWGTRRIFELSSDSAQAVVDNNILFMNDNSYAIWAGNPNLRGSNNWISEIGHGDSVFVDNIIGDDPGFVDFENQDFHLAEHSPCIDVVEGYMFPDGHDILFQYVPHLDFEHRPITNDALDIGAFYFPNEGDDNWAGNMNRAPKEVELISLYPNPFNSTINLNFSAPIQGNIRLTVYSTTGKELLNLRRTFTTVGTGISLPLGGLLPAGAYFIDIRTENSAETRRIVLAE